MSESPNGVVSNVQFPLEMKFSTPDEDLINFLISANTKANVPYSRWIEYGPMNVYLRRSIRNGKWYGYNGLIPVLDIANVIIQDETQRGQGHFKSFLREAVHYTYQKTSVKILYVENVFNKKLARHLYTEGWQVEDKWRGVPSFWKDLSM